MIIWPSSGSSAVTSFNGSNESPTVNTLSVATITGALFTAGGWGVGFFSHIEYKSIIWFDLSVNFVTISSSLYTTCPFGDVAQPLNSYPSKVNSFLFNW